jgi:uncharacterized protein (DUF736 family)
LWYNTKIGEHKNMNTNEQKNNEWSKRDIGALWKKEGKSGKYLSGYFKDELGEQVEIVIFSNKFKGENAKAPDYRVYISKVLDSKNTTNQVSAKVATTTTKKVATAKQAVTEEDQEDLL